VRRAVFLSVLLMVRCMSLPMALRDISSDAHYSVVIESKADIGPV
jgi:hypothetical protein